MIGWVSRLPYERQVLVIYVFAIFITVFLALAIRRLDSLRLTG